VSTLELSNQRLSPTKLHTLSGLRLEHTNFTRPKPLLLLAYLCIEGRKEKRFLAELFWPGASNHLNSLAKALSQLRGVGVVDNDDTHAWATVSSDVNEFLDALEERDLGAVITLYQDSFLSGFYLPDWGPELEEWIYTTREFLASHMRAVWLELAEASRDPQEITRYAERAYEQEATLEPELIVRLYKLLSTTPYAAKLKQEAKEFGISLEEKAKTITSNLPSRGTTFIGRDIERLELGELLSQDDVRLLTIIGQGGVGKTRLALEVARELQDSFPDGVVYFPVENLVTPEQMLKGLASALSIQLTEEDCTEQLPRIIGDKKVLLLMDSLEYQVESAYKGSLFLARCPNLKILVTSRVRLNLEEEWLYTLEGFSLPSDLEFRQAELNDAVALFTQRAKKVKQSFVLTKESLPLVLEICRRVEGLPLGIELAASWVKTMSCEAIVTQLDDLDFLTSPLANVPERQQSLRSVFEGSWNLLSKEEQSVLSKLSIFRGSFTSEAAREVAGASLMMLARLVDKSLLRVTNGRYDQHALLKTFMAEKLAASPSEEATKAAHAAYFLALAEEAEPHLKTNQQKIWLPKLEEDLGNLRSAFVWLLGSEKTLTSALSLMNALGVFFRSYGHTPQGRLWLQEALAASQHQEPSSERAEVLHDAATLARMHGEYDKALGYFQESLAVWQTLHDEERIARINGDLSILFSEQGNYAAAEKHLGLALSHFRATNNTKMLAVAIYNLADLYRGQGRLKEAHALLEESLVLFRKVDLEFGVTGSLMALGSVAYEQADYPTAWDYCQESLTRLRKDTSKIILLIDTLILASRTAHALDKKEEAFTFIRESLEHAKKVDNTSSMILGLEGLALVLGQTNPEKAVSLWAAAEGSRNKVQFVRTAGDKLRFERELLRLRADLVEEVFSVAWTKGQATGLEQTVVQSLEMFSLEI
jgi:predicted ATPase